MMHHTVLNSNFRLSGLIGRSVPMPPLFVSDYWAGFASNPAFLGNRTVEEVTSFNMEIVGWNLDRLYSMAAFRPGSLDEVRPVLPALGVDFETGMRMIVEDSWTGGTQINGRILASVPLSSSKISITVTSTLALDGHYRYFVKAAHLSEPQSGDQVVDFLQGLLSQFGMSSLVEFNMDSFPPQCKILDGCFGGIGIKSIYGMQDRNVFGDAGRSLSLVMNSLDKVNEAIRHILRYFEGGHIVWLTGSTWITDGRWDEARKGLEKLHSGPWIYNHHRVPCEAWTPSKFLLEADNYDIIPVGCFDCTRGRKISIPTELKGNIFHVDLFREGELWYFAFHAVEGDFQQKRREAIRAALNDYMGQELISRSLEMIWPGLLPEKKGKPKRKAP